MTTENNEQFFNTLTLHEQTPRNRVKNAMACNMDIIPIDEKKKLDKYSRTYSVNLYRTDYQWPTVKEWGRVKQVPYTGLGTFYGPLRGYLANGIYLDIDVVNCHPTILRHEFQKKSIDTSIIDDYVLNRESFLKNESIDKEEFLKMINKEDFKHPSEKITKLHTQIYKMLIPMLLNDNHEIMTLINKSRTHNKFGKFIGNYLQSVEFKVLAKLYKYSLRQDIFIDVLMHDGFFVRITETVNENFMASVLLQYSDLVKKEFDMDFKFKIKPHDLSLKVPDISEMTPLEIHTEILLEYAKENNLKKFGTVVYKQKNNHPMYFEDYYHEYNKTNKENPKNLRDFINEVFKNNKLFNSATKYSNELFEYISSRRDIDDFPELLKNLNFIAFKNGTLQLYPIKFYSMEDIEISDVKKCVCRNYIDYNFSNSTETPHFDNLLSHQLSKESYTTLRILTGRLFFNLNEHDRWQVAPYIKGDAHTGKSTLMSLIEFIMGEENVGTLTKDDKVFQLSGIYNKDITIIPDIKDCKSYIDEDIAQSIISGERVSIRIMRTTPFSHVWNKPIIFGSNFMPDWSDSEGALLRRLVLFLFSNTIDEKDSKLLNKLCEESGSIVLKCVSEYFEFIKEHPGEADFNKFLGEDLQVLKKDFKEFSDPLSEFLGLGRQRIGDHYYSIIYKEGEKCKVNDFKKRFENWLSGTKHDQTFRLNTKHTEFKKNGFVYSEEKVCKSCGNKAAKGCCDNYNKLNRTTMKYYENMMMLKEPVSFPFNN